MTKTVICELANTQRHKRKEKEKRKKKIKPVVTKVLLLPRFVLFIQGRLPFDTKVF